MRAAVVGHVEWIEFARVDHVPRPGEIVHATEAWGEPGGGGGVVAVQLAKLAGESILFTALGDDELGHRALDELRTLGVRVEATFRPEPQRRAFTYVDRAGERTITVIGDRMGPHGADRLDWGLLDAASAVYVTAGDRAAIRAARRARVLVGTARILTALGDAAVTVDALVGSGRDAGERFVPGVLDPPPGILVETLGAEGGRYRMRDGTEGTFDPAPLPGPISDAYGAGDSFAGGLTYALGAGLPLKDALEVAAKCGAWCLTGRGPYAGQLTRADLRHI